MASHMPSTGYAVMIYLPKPMQFTDLMKQVSHSPVNGDEVAKINIHGYGILLFGVIPKTMNTEDFIPFDSSIMMNHLNNSHSNLSILAWNIQGVGSRHFMLMKEIIWNYNPSVLALDETKASAFNVDFICQKIGLIGSLGFKFKALMGNLIALERRIGFLYLIVAKEKFVILEVKPREKSRGSYSMVIIQGIELFFHEITPNLGDLGFSGSQFTWSRGRDPKTMNHARLDWASIISIGISIIKWQQCDIYLNITPTIDYY
ncbi:hypothetical protein Cgig2_012533 [Carnegiea gigantea]|uniref:Uncharacterized protein n=1 Tax=Carnegiea gigantea TaxID=171969 RepID=A0A9Q1GJV7_9CARY|nr:hypothetical protein Cgig2_012533 [Carnegiea gigantea]